MLKIYSAGCRMLLALLAVVAVLLPCRADDWGAVVLRARVVDRTGKPVPTVQVRFEADLNGVVRGINPGLGTGPEPTQAFTKSDRQTAFTNTDGVATVTIAPPFRPATPHWFRGGVRFTVQAVSPPQSGDVVWTEATAFGPSVVDARISIPQSEAGELPTALPTLAVWEIADTSAEGFPIWLGRDKVADRIVVVVEGFDFYNDSTATDTLRLMGATGDALRAAGLDLLVVSFDDSHQPPDKLAPLVAQAVRAASKKAGGRPVAVVGLSAGGIVARWSLVTAENENAPLPVHTLVFLDTPHRGARINPALQALFLRYGREKDREATNSEAAQVLRTESITDVDKQVTWRTIGPPLLRRAVPVAVRPTSLVHDAFYARLRALNDRNGYPKRCRLVAIANSSRADERPEGNLLRVWLPFGSGWTLRAEPADRVPGSLLPGAYAGHVSARYPLGIAGVATSLTPTFLPAASALDAEPGETPPFAAWYARPAGSVPLAHNEVDPAAAAFFVRELVQGAWVQ